MSNLEVNQIVEGINSREALFEVFSEFMNNNYERLSIDQKNANTWIKTPLLEMNENIHKIDFGYGQYEVNLVETEDKYIYKLIVEYKDTRLIIFIDIFDDRIPVFYSINKSYEFSQYINNLVKNSLNIDNTWFPQNLFGSIQGNYQDLGFSIGFQQSVVTEGDDIEDFNLRLSTKTGKRTSKLLQILQENDYPIVRNRITLQKFEENESLLHFQSNIYYDGKITVKKGKSFDSHLDLVHQIRKSYKTKLINLEELFLQYDTSNNNELQGEIVEIKYKSIEPVVLYNSIFDGTSPFRIWGAIRKKEDDIIYIDAVDIHTGSKFDVEIMDSIMRIYLRGGQCSNILMRLLTNLQHHYDPSARLLIYGEEYL